MTLPRPGSIFLIESMTSLTSSMTIFLSALNLSELKLAERRYHNSNTLHAASISWGLNTPAFRRQFYRNAITSFPLNPSAKNPTMWQLLAVLSCTADGSKIIVENRNFHRSKLPGQQGNQRGKRQWAQNRGNSHSSCYKRWFYIIFCCQNS